MATQHRYISLIGKCAISRTCVLFKQIQIFLDFGWDFVISFSSLVTEVFVAMSSHTTLSLEVEDLSYFTHTVHSSVARAYKMLCLTIVCSVIHVA